MLEPISSYGSADPWTSYRSADPFPYEVYGSVDPYVYTKGQNGKFAKFLGVPLILLCAHSSVQTRITQNKPMRYGASKKP